MFTVLTSPYLLEVHSPLGDNSSASITMSPRFLLGVFHFCLARWWQVCGHLVGMVKGHDSWVLECLHQISLNILLVGPATQWDLLLNNMGKWTPWIKSEVTSLGVVLDQDLSFELPIKRQNHHPFQTKCDYLSIREMLKNRFMYLFQVIFINSLTGFPDKTNQRH